MKLAVVLVLLVVGTIIFHFISPWWFTPIASNWDSVDFTIDITFWITGAVFVAVNGFLAYVVWRYRYRKDQQAHYEPENKKLESWLTALTAIGVIAMLAPGLVVWQKVIDVPEDAYDIEVMGQQWQWGFRFPGNDAVLGRVDARFVSPENPFGIDPEDPAGQDDILVDSNEVTLPIGKPVRALLRSKDVLHNFAVPQFRVKMDLVPGMVSYVWFTPTREGRFDILCMELCGIAHHAMRGDVVVVEESRFDTWLATQPTFAQSQTLLAGDAAVGRALYTVCASCHGESGEGNDALQAPSLAGQDARYLRRQIFHYKNGIRGAHKDDLAGQQMAAMAAVLQDEKAVRDVVAHILTMPDAQIASAESGDAKRGEHLFETCSACHGRQGEGNPALNAPKLASLQDWYFKKQMQNFRAGIRGGHPHDIFGVQMMLMAKMLRDDRAIDDVYAYIKTL